MKLNTNDKLSKTTLFFSFALSITTLIWLLIRARYGFNISDETYYLNWISDPFIYSPSVTQFGFMYHPLNKILNGDIVHLRQSNILIIFGLAWLLFYLFFKKTLKNNCEIYFSFWNMLVLAFIFAISSSAYACTFRWLITPSYNSLLLQALLLVSIGVLLTENTPSKTSILGWILIGIAGVFALMAKPPAAVILAVAIIVFFSLQAPKSIRYLFISFFTSIVFLFILAWCIDGSITQFVHRFKIGFGNIKLLESNGKLLRIDKLNLDGIEQMVLASSILILSVLSYFISKQKYLRIIGLIIISIFTFTGFLVIFNIWPKLFNPHDLAVFQLISIPISAIILSMLIQRKDFFSTLSRQHLALSFFWLSLPYVMAFGTRNNYWIQGQLAAVFWILSGLTILMPAMRVQKNWTLLLPLAIGTQLITLLLLQLAMEYPYQQIKPLDQYQNKVTIGVSHSEIILQKDYADFFRDIQSLFVEKGFNNTIPVIDLTGQSPGILYAIGSKPIGLPWFMGGHPGSDKFIMASLSEVACKDIAPAWILLEPKSTSKISAKILKNFGLDLHKNYELVTKLILPTGLGGAEPTTQRKQILLKPRSVSESLLACEKIKNINT